MHSVALSLMVSCAIDHLAVTTCSPLVAATTTTTTTTSTSLFPVPPPPPPAQVGNDGQFNTNIDTTHGVSVTITGPAGSALGKDVIFISANETSGQFDAVVPVFATIPVARRRRGKWLLCSGNVIMTHKC